ncbi:MAG: glycine/sarcosine/betaine reductase selenoprotein B family protein [Alphaproteobacteria bacterium]
MVRLTDLPDALRALVQRCEVPTHTDTPWTPGVPMAEQRVAIVSTAGLQRAGDRPFDFDSDDYRVIPGDVDPATILMSHISSDFDRSGFQQDINVVLPLQRLQEMAAEGEIASVAGYHYSFMGATHPDDMEERARQLAGLMKADCVNTVLLAPV